MCDETNYQNCLKCGEFQNCTEADDVRVANEEDGWHEKHQYLDPHPRSEED